MSVTTLSMNMASFVLNKYFPILSKSIGMYGCLCLMSVTCIFGILFVIFVMEETRGKSLDSIESARDQKEKPVPASNDNF